MAGDVTVGLDAAAEPFVYLPLAQHPRFLNAPVPMVLLARARSNSTALAASMRGVLQAIDPALPVTEIAPLDDRIAELLMPRRLGSALLSALGGLTIVLVIVGAAGTVAYGVSRRRREIGVRLALGARRVQVAGAMTRGALVSMAGGVLAGIIGAAALGRLASAFLYGIEPTDATSFAAAAIVIVLATGAASFLPAWRAAGIDPAEILKAEQARRRHQSAIRNRRSLIADSDRRRGHGGAPDGRGVAHRVAVRTACIPGGAKNRHAGGS